jgi:signal transduction histidine kinase
LGLAISKEFIEAQRGKIWVESEIGEGAKFCFSLPT